MEKGGGGIYFGEKLKRRSKIAWTGLITRRLRAWGVLGFAAGGCFIFSLLTLFVFRSSNRRNPGPLQKFRLREFFFNLFCGGTFFAAAPYLG
jgi:hypothetical protein